MNKRVLSAILALLLAFSALGCSGFAEPLPEIESMQAKAGSVKPSKVILDRSGTVTMMTHETLQLSAAVKPDTAGYTLKWVSSKPGLVTAGGKEGITTITVKTGNGKKDTVKIKVVDPTKATSVAISLDGKVLKSGASVSLLTTATLSLQAVMKPDTATSQITWSSSNKSVATVENGVVKPVSEGTASITVKTSSGKKAALKVSVKEDPSAPIPVPDGYSLPYVIYACKKSHTFAVVERDENGDFTKVVQLFSTGMGRNGSTRTGTFTIKGKQRWHRWGSTYSPYTSKLSNGAFIHGPIYRGKSSHKLIASTYNAVGTNCSGGCLRTTCGAASWVYSHCPNGTLVIIRNNRRYAASRPKQIRSSQNYDPSDPAK